MNSLHRTQALVLALSAAAAVQTFAGGIHKEIKRGSEKEVRVKIESSFGTVICSKGSSDKIVVFDLKTDEDRKPNVDIDYRVKGEVGYLDISPENDGNRSYSFHMNDEDDEDKDRDHMETGKWYMEFSDAVPLSVDAELGAGKGNFDMTGLDVKDFRMSAGASSTNLYFGEPNKSEIEELEIKSGVSKFVGEKLCNANFRRMTFEGGVGSYYLNFEGKLDREVDVRIKIGLGAVTIAIPKEAGARVHYEEHWFSNFTIDRDFDEEHKGEYVTSNYSTAEGKLNITVESGLGSVKVKILR
ncbi:MAG TPA: hypothetical protein VMG34_11330 [Bacteroidota bacterium]|nr:hypothetical protein [Bacteroidota bacterium]